MGTKAESCQQMGSEDTERRYLFFGDELFVGDTRGEKHKEILESSNRVPEEVVVAGGYSVFSGGCIIIDGEGSDGLEIPKRNPTPVVKFVKSFPDANKKEVIVSVDFI